MRKRWRIPTAARGHADVICLSDTMTGSLLLLHVNGSASESMDDWSLLLDSSGPGMKLVKALIMDGECISIFPDTCDLIYAVMQPLLMISSL